MYVVLGLFRLHPKVSPQTSSLTLDIINSSLHGFKTVDVIGDECRVFLEVVGFGADQKASS